MSVDTEPKRATAPRPDYELFFLSFFVSLALFVGWKIRRYHLIASAHGVGYLLGITGGVLILILLLYPLRKRMSNAPQRPGVLKRWLQMHMLLGTLAPVFILYHCNFHLGDVNSNIALLTMLVVASSGVFGRYFYGQIHHGLYGEKETLAGMQARLKQENDHLSLVLKHFPELAEELSRFAAHFTGTGRNLSGSFVQVLITGHKVRAMQHKIKKMTIEAVAAYAGHMGWSARKTKIVERSIDARVKSELASIIRIAKFTFYNHLFSLWHVLHIPLFFIMLTAVIVHIFTAHIY